MVEQQPVEINSVERCLKSWQGILNRGVRKMGYFSGLTSLNFKVDSSGRHVYYQSGAFGRGYVLPDEKTYLKVRSIKICYHLVSIIGVMVIGASVGPRYILALIPFAYLWHRVEDRKLLSSLPITSEKFSLSESTAAAARSFSLLNLWLGLVACLIFVLAGTWIILSKGPSWTGFISVSFFGLGLAQFIRLLRSRRSQKGNT